MSLNPCPCGDWGKCAGPRQWWFSYPEFVYCPNQVIWVLGNLSIFEQGTWPTAPPSGYVDLHLEKPVFHPGNARFEKAIEIAADIIQRRERTGVEGRWLQEKIDDCEDWRYLELSPECRMALNYIAGNFKTRWNKKTEEYEPMPYSQWKAERKYKAKERTTARFSGKPELTRIQIQERKGRKRGARR